MCVLVVRNIDAGDGHTCSCHQELTVGTAQKVTV